MKYTLDNTKDIVMCHPSVFANNPIVKRLTSDPQWTMSDNLKRPVDAEHLLATGDVINASLDGPSPLVTLDRIDADDRLAAVNRAYRLHARDNRVIAIDVEPEASDAMKESVLNFPSHYTELSKNGGVHLFILVPEDLVDDNNRYMFDDLSVFKEPVPKGESRPAHFEVMFNDHYITFTKRMLVDKPAANFVQDLDAKAKLKAFLDQMVELDKERKKNREIAKQYKVEMYDKSIDDDTMQAIQTFIELRGFDRPKMQAGEKTADDYGGDKSLYESSTASSIASHVIRIHRMAKTTISFSDIAYKLKDSDLIYAVYLILKDIIPHRDKHDETRDDLPWLVYVAKNAYEYIKAQDAKERRDKYNKKKGG